MPDRRWLILGLVFAARAATGFQFQSVGSASRPLMAEFGISYAQIGILLGAYLLPGIVVALPAGLIAQRIPDKKLAIAGLVLMIVSGMALAVSGGFAAALVARTIGGAGATVVIIALTKMTADWFDGREIILAMAILQVSWPFGAMLALPVYAHILQAWGWPAAMASSALFAVCTLIPLACFYDRPVADRAQQSAMSCSAKLPPSTFASIIVAGTIWGAMNLVCVLFFSFAPLLMVARGLSATAAASLTSAAIWLTILSIPSGGYLIHRLGRPITAIIVCSLTAAGALAGFTADIYPVISCLLFGIAVGPLSGAILSLPTKVLNPVNRAAGFGLFYMCFYVLMAVGPLIAGRLQDLSGSPMAGLLAGVALLAAVTPLSIVFKLLTGAKPLAAFGKLAIRGTPVRLPAGVEH